ncbi:MAG TPA: protoporphyrinogen oxidase [Terriglobales bacterium]|nr:protoporphyrinogen oxidase [Terriglobales bacterium]
MRVSIAIVGAGIAGLSAAWELARAGRRDFVLLEASPRAGGVIATESHDGFVFEAGPDSFLTSKPAGATLCRELGLEAEMIPTLPNPGGARIWHRGRFHPLPAGWQMLAPTRLRPLLASGVSTGLLRPGVKLGLAARWWRTPPPPPGEESVAQYLRRRFGRVAGQALADTIAGPLLAGVYGGNCEQLSAAGFLAASAPRPPAAHARPPGASLFTSLQGGMGSLIEALVAHLPPGALRLASPVAGLRPAPGGGYRLELASGEALEAAAVIVATPAWAAAQLLGPLDPALAEPLAAIPYASSVNVNLAYAAAPALPAGHGFLASRGQGVRLLACTFAHQKFAHRAPPGGAVLRVFYGGELAQAPEAEVAALAQAELRQLLGLATSPLRLAVRRCSRAMAQVTVGHQARLAALAAAAARHPRLRLAGNAYQGIGVPDCIATGRAAAAGLP